MRSLTLILLAVFGFAATSLSAQVTKKQRKMLEAIETLEATSFVKEFKSCKSTVENVMRDFNDIAAEYPAGEVRRIEAGYAATEDALNDILMTLRDDLLDPEIRAFIIKKPGRHAADMETKLKYAMDLFDRDVRAPIMELTGDAPVGFGIADIKMIIDMVIQAVDAIKAMRRTFDEMNEDFLDEHFTDELKVATATELKLEMEEAGR